MNIEKDKLGTKEHLEKYLENRGKEIFRDEEFFFEIKEVYEVYEIYDKEFSVKKSLVAKFDRVSRKEWAVYDTYSRRLSADGHDYDLYYYWYSNYVNEKHIFDKEVDAYKFCKKELSSKICKLNDKMTEIDNKIKELE